MKYKSKQCEDSVDAIEVSAEGVNEIITFLEGRQHHISGEGDRFKVSFQDGSGWLTVLRGWFLVKIPGSIYIHILWPDVFWNLYDPVVPYGYNT